MNYTATLCDKLVTIELCKEQCVSDLVFGSLVQLAGLSLTNSMYTLCGKGRMV